MGSIPTKSRIYEQLVAMTEAELLEKLSDGRTRPAMKNMIGSILLGRGAATSEQALRQVIEYCAVTSTKLADLACVELNQRGLIED